MGSEGSKLQQLAENWHELESELRRSKHKTNVTDVKKHGWDERDKSPNISIQDDNQLATRGSQSGCSDGVRGRIGYKGGVFLFEFEWKPGDNKNVCVGLATTKASLKCEGRKALIGANEFSVGWDLVNRCIRFNDCKIKSYPDSDTSPIPSTFTMILDMSDGTVAFRAGSRDYGVAMKGLKHLSSSFFIAASMDEPDDSIKMTYLGSLERIKQALLSSSGSSSSGLRFHETCGKNIRLTNGNRTAERKNPDDTHMYATALTHRPLKDGETFTVRCDARDKRRTGAWVFGATTVPPQDMDFPKEMTRCEQGKRWIYNENKILFQNKRAQEVNIDLDDLRSGDKIGIKKCGDELHFLINGDRIARVMADTEEDIYGVVDVFGRTTRVSIIDESGGSPRSGQGDLLRTLSGGDDKHAVLMRVLPKTHEEFLSRLHSTINHLKDKSPDKIGKIRQQLKIDMLIPFSVLKSDRVKKEAAEKLGAMEDGAQLITDYLQFLWDLGLDSGEDVDKTYSVLLDIVINYGDKSLLLSKKFGESGLVKRLIQELHRMKDTHTGNNRESNLVREYFIVLHNCAKAAENRPIYRECQFLELGKHYADTAVNADFIVTNAYLTMSYICDDDQLELLAVTDKTAEHLVRILSKSADNERDDGTHNHDGWHCYEIADGITNLARYQPNIAKFMREDAVTYFIKMLSFSDAHDKECGLNGIWSLVTPENRKDIIKSGGLSHKLRSLASYDREGVRQAAIRLLTRLVNITHSGDLGKQKKRQCDYKARCARFKTNLKIPEDYLDSSADACYCAECHGLRGDEAYYCVGDPPKRYGVPVGWCKFGLRLPPRAAVLKVAENWHRAYHGTKQDHIEGILSVGEIVPAGRPVLGGVNIAEGSGHFKSDWKPEGFDTKRVFLSPSIRYSGVSAYAKPKLYTDSTSECKYIAKVVMEVFIAPGSYAVSPETVGVTEELDPGFNNQELEWSTNQHGSCILQGLLVKLDSTETSD